MLRFHRVVYWLLMYLHAPAYSAVKESARAELASNVQLFKQEVAAMLFGEKVRKGAGPTQAAHPMVGR